MRNRISVQLGMVVSLFAFLILAILFPNFTPNTQVEILLGATTFIYGIIIAFYISFSTNRLNEVGQILNSEDATYVSIHRVSSVYGEEKQKKLLGLIDNLLVSSIDYHLRDYDKTFKEFNAMSDYIIKLEPETKSQEQSYATLLNLIQQNQQNRTRISALVKQGLFWYEWLVLIVLNCVVVFCVFYLNTHSFVSILVSTFLATSTVVLLFILRDLTSLVWREQTWIWDSLRQTFSEMGLLPYYPKDTLKENRAKLNKGDKARVAVYSHPYPNFKDKIIDEIVI